MAACPYGKASLVFPLAIPAGAALAAVEATEEIPEVQARVIGYTTPLTSEAGACSVRFAVAQPLECSPGNYLVAVRSKNHVGWLPGLANTKHQGEELLLEVVVLGRPDRRLQAVMYLPQETLSALWPCDGSEYGACLRLMKTSLLPQLSDCPGQWLRDRLLKLADMVEVQFKVKAGVASAALGAQLEAAGLQLVDSLPESMSIGPADKGARIDEQELGYWTEEMDKGHRCAGAMDDSRRQDVPDEIYASML
eukprot:CAMPEP_0172803554 /NCGR_PEP_ID=MMETSP1075-20121228/4582_1 /TAXON_ID=2916 /ORGANISM="Ceratium fusus, Strain PA161109" /LENGTH=250 /DNA_ID=CAMNT_0013641997 /DNA_START=30 /DNA_END=782 /DNA_ORIENTATION=+